MPLGNKMPNESKPRTSELHPVSPHDIEYSAVPAFVRCPDDASVISNLRIYNGLDSAKRLAEAYLRLR